MNVGKYSFDEIRSKLYSSVISDALDNYGYWKQTLDKDIRPLDPNFVIFGRAFTVLGTEVYEVPDEPYKLNIRALDRVSQDEVYVATSQNSTRAGFFGELFATACRRNGAVGAIIDGLSRDTKAILKMGFPVFSRGFMPQDSKGRLEVVDMQVTIEINRVQIRPGDYVFADIDGTIIIPQEVAEKVIEFAMDKASGENKVRARILEGASCEAVFKEYGIL